MDKPPSIHVTCAHCGTKNRIAADRLAEHPLCGRCGHELLDGAPVELTDDNFDAVTAGTELPVLVDFWAPWCGPCRAMAPQFEQAASSLRGRALLAKVNSDDNPHAAARFGIRSIPTLVRLERGREVARQSGTLPAAQIVRFGS
ncbi:MAG TPA: thioredoxin TrxC [Burkholderiaceae bacterium]|nr:thioredoxin TrxC [Burkholderiaceae bacterium]